MVIAPGGKVLFRSGGRVDILKTRRIILSSFPDDDYVGQNAYWNSKQLPAASCQLPASSYQLTSWQLAA